MVEVKRRRININNPSISIPSSSTPSTPDEAVFSPNQTTRRKITLWNNENQEPAISKMETTENIELNDISLQEKDIIKDEKENIPNESEVNENETLEIAEQNDFQEKEEKSSEQNILDSSVVDESFQNEVEQNLLEDASSIDLDDVEKSIEQDEQNNISNNQEIEENVEIKESYTKKILVLDDREGKKLAKKLLAVEPQAKIFPIANVNRPLEYKEYFDQVDYILLDHYFAEDPWELEEARWEDVAKYLFQKEIRTPVICIRKNIENFFETYPYWNRLANNEQLLAITEKDAEKIFDIIGQYEQWTLKLVKWIEIKDIFEEDTAKLTQDEQLELHKREEEKLKEEAKKVLQEKEEEKKKSKIELWSEEEMSKLPTYQSPLNNKFFISIGISLVLFAVGIFAWFYRDTIFNLVKPKEVNVVINKTWVKESKQNTNQAQVVINVKEKEIFEKTISSSNLDYLKLKVQSLFPFYDIWDVTTMKLQDLVEEKFASTSLNTYIHRINDQAFKNLTAFSFDFKIVDLTNKDIIKKALLEGSQWENAISILFQLYERITGLKVTINIDTAEWKQTFLTYLTKKLFADEGLVKQFNKELKKVWQFFNNYLILFANPDTNEYLTIKEYLSKDREILEKILPIDDLPYFDTFIDYKGSSFKGEVEMILTIGNKIRDTEFYLKPSNRISKEDEQTFKKLEEFLHKLDFYSEYILMIDKANTF